MTSLPQLTAFLKSDIHLKLLGDVAALEKSVGFFFTLEKKKKGHESFVMSQRGAHSSPVLVTARC